mgnify:CR=1 FL=1
MLELFFNSYCALHSQADTRPAPFRRASCSATLVKLFLSYLLRRDIIQFCKNTIIRLWLYDHQVWITIWVSENDPQWQPEHMGKPLLMFEEEGQQEMKQPRCSTFILCGDIDSIAPKSAHYI